MNSDELGFALLAFTSMLAIVNPLGAVPIYVTLTGDFTRERRLATLRDAIVRALAWPGGSPCPQLMPAAA